MFVKNLVTRNLVVAFAVSYLCLSASSAYAVIVAGEDFDGGDVGLISSSVPALDGGGGDFVGVGSIAGWPQAAGVPFSLADDSVFDVSGNGSGSPFPSDTEGVWGLNSDFDNDFFAISDAREWTTSQLVASWEFDISGFTDLTLSIDFGGQSNGNSFGGFTAGQNVIFTYEIDSVPVGTAFDISAGAAPGGFAYRAMDSGASPTTGGVLLATGDNPVTKFLADTGLAAPDTALDKTPATGPGAGTLDTFVTSLDGMGSTLTLNMQITDFDFEAMAFDNIVIEGVPEPASMALLALGSLGFVIRRRK